MSHSRSARPVGVEDLVERGVALIAEGDLIRLVLRKVGTGSSPSSTISASIFARHLP